MSAPVTLRSTFAPVYRKLLPAFFDQPAIVETRATCENCAMCARADTVAGVSGVSVVHFAPDLKCCTYHPTLPNYLVGAIFADPDPALSEGRRRLDEKIAARIGVTPQWLAAPRKHALLLDAARLSSFGRSRALLCPYYQDGLCSIWRHREAVCSTFFCKYESAARGHAAWDALKRYFYLIERLLSARAAQAIDESLTEPAVARGRLTQADLEDRPPPDDEYRGFWGEWAGHEREFYLRCYEFVAGLDAGDCERLHADSPELRARLEEAEQRHAALDVTGPSPRLVLGSELSSVPVPDGAVVTTYSRYDSLFLSQALRDALSQFRADESVAETKARLKREQGLDLPDDVIELLERYEVLVPPKA
jgi:Fe-S-cluster containining protein